jgi:hypothetical protein
MRQIAVSEIMSWSLEKLSFIIPTILWRDHSCRCIGKNLERMANDDTKDNHSHHHDESAPSPAGSSSTTIHYVVPRILRNVNGTNLRLQYDALLKRRAHVVRISYDPNHPGRGPPPLPHDDEQFDNDDIVMTLTPPQEFHYSVTQPETQKSPLSRVWRKNELVHTRKQQTKPTVLKWDLGKVCTPWAHNHMLSYFPCLHKTNTHMPGARCSIQATLLVSCLGTLCGKRTTTTIQNNVWTDRAFFRHQNHDGNAMEKVHCATHGYVSWQAKHARSSDAVGPKLQLLTAPSNQDETHNRNKTHDTI